MLQDIEIRFENVVASQCSYEHGYEDLVEADEEPRSTSPSPLELQEVDQIKKKEEEEVRSHEPVRIINPPLSKFGHMSKSGVHPVYL